MSAEPRADRYYRKLSHCVDFKARVDVLSEQMQLTLRERDFAGAAICLNRIQGLSAELREKLEKEV